MSTRNREAGHNFERKIVNEMKALLDSTSIVTSRAESRNMDNLGADIIDTKVDNQRQLPLVVFHNKVTKATKNFRSIGEYVVMEKDAYYDLIKHFVQMPHNIQCKIYTNNPNYHTIIQYYNNNK